MIKICESEKIRLREKKEEEEEIVFNVYYYYYYYYCYRHAIKKAR